MAATTWNQGPFPSAPMTDIAAVRTLIGDTSGSPFFTDTQISEFCGLAFVNGPGAEYFLAASMAIRAIAAYKATNLQEVRIGDFTDSSGRNQITALNATADAFETIFYETPAWAIIETDESDLNALIIIRNYVLRTNP